MLSPRSLAFQAAVGVFHKGGVEETEAKVVPEGADDRDVAAGVHIAGVCPFEGFYKTRVAADGAEVEQAELME